MRIMCDELDKTARLWMSSIQSALDMPPLFSRSLRPGVSAGASCLSSILIAWLFDDVIPASHSVSPPPAPVIPAPPSVYHVASLLCLLVSPYRLASHRSASRPVSRVVERGDVILRAWDDLLALSVRCDNRSAAGACLCLLRDVERCGDVDKRERRGSLILAMGSPVRRRCGMCSSLRACLAHRRFPYPSSSRIAMRPASLPSRPSPCLSCRKAGRD